MNDISFPFITYKLGNSNLCDPSCFLFRSPFIPQTNEDSSFPFTLNSHFKFNNNQKEKHYRFDMKNDKIVIIWTE